MRKLKIKTSEKNNSEEAESLFSPASFQDGSSLRDEGNFSGLVKFEILPLESKNSFKKCSGKVLMVFNTSKTIDFYDSLEHFQRDVDPTCSYLLKDVSFMIVDQDNFEMVVSNSNEKMFVQCETEEDFDKLVMTLRIRRFNLIPSEPIHNSAEEEEEDEGEDEMLEKGTPIKNWSNEDVLQWSKEVLIGKSFETTFFEIAEEYIRENNITGSSILNWNTDEDVDRFLRNFSFSVYHRRELRRALNKMRISGVYDDSLNRVAKKVVKMLNQQKKKIRFLELYRIRKSFAYEYLVMKKILEVLYLGNEESIEKSRKFQVKVNIIENIASEKLKRVRKGLSRLLEIKDSIPFLGNSNGDQSDFRFGMYHTSISIGNLQLEWVNCELVIIRIVSSQKAIISADVGEIIIFNGNELALKLAREIVKWNVYYRYHSSKSSENGGNCQTFVNRILEHLKIDFSLDPLVEKYIKRMKYRGSNNIEFRFNKEFGNKFFKNNEHLKKPKCFKPKSHAELDLLLIRLQSICPDFENEYPSEYNLLKIFDRGFWMKYRSEKEQNQGEYPLESLNAPLNVRENKGKKKKKSSDCPFI